MKGDANIIFLVRRLEYMREYVEINIDKTDIDAQELKSLAISLVAAMKKSKLTFASAESCTGGLIGGMITSASGSSDIYLGGIITYTNDVKIGVLGVDKDLIDEHTEVSFCVAEDMAKKVKEKLGADIGVSATGYAGPTGGTQKDPVGTVYVGIAFGDYQKTFRLSFKNCVGREEIRLMVVEFVLTKLLLFCA